MNAPVNRSTVPAFGVSRLRVGFLALSDAAPFIVAERLGLYRNHGIEVELSLEVGWATIRDKIADRQLDAAHALGPMPFALTLGLGSVPCPCLTGLVLGAHGNGITVSRELHEAGVADAAQLRPLIQRDRGRRTYTFGAVFPFSSHWTLLHRWLRNGGIDPERDVKLVIVPPSLLFRTLSAGHIDGYCVGEPWNTLAAQRKTGAWVAMGADIEPAHPEKVLLVRKDFHQERPEEHLALIAALLEACRFCEDPANRDELVHMLTRDGRLRVTESVLRQSFEGRFAPGILADSDPGRIIRYHGSDTNRPSAEKAEWILEALLENNAFPKMTASPANLGARIFREDLFNEACLRSRQGAAC